MFQVSNFVFHTPTTILVSGATGSGKTTWLKKVLDNLSIFKRKPDRIVYCYGVWQPAFDDMKNVEFREGLDIPKNNENDHMLIILDDLMTAVVESPIAHTLFTKGSHHMNITVILVVQNFFVQGKHARTITLNCHYMVIMKNPRDIQQIKLIGRQIGQEVLIQEAYKDCMKEQYGYLLIDLSPHNINEQLRIKSHIFPQEDLVVYLAR